MHPHANAEMRRSSMPDLDDDALLNSAQVKARFGNVTDMCLWRWMRDPRVFFPKPLKINRRNYWKLGSLRQWQQEHVSKCHLEFSNDAEREVHRRF